MKGTRSAGTKRTRKSTARRGVGKQRRPQARGVVTRDKLLAAARELFTRRGYAGVTIADVARRAKCSLSTAYYHFPDKRDLLLRLIDEWGRTKPAERRTAFDIRTALSGEPRRAAREFLQRSHREARKGPSFHRVILAEAQRDPVVRRHYEAAQQAITGWLAMLIRIGQQTGLVRPGIAPEAAAFLINRIIEPTLDEVVAEKLPDELQEDVVEELIEMIGRYVLGPAADPEG